ncbi:MAG TPA: NADH-quinone oxidoreductase subunit K [Bryobacteraceae bacterium]|jgi:hydrogenase-4 component E|nr:NADH-quinone oxidoreductase subunit K [Bryobacteraceae bacterium]
MFLFDPQFGERMITLMAAFLLVLQIAMVGQRMLITNIRLYAIQSALLASIAMTIAWFNREPHVYLAAALTLALKCILLPRWLERLVDRIGIPKEIQPLLNVPASLIISGGLTLVGYLVAHPFAAVEPGNGSLGHNTLAVAVSLFLMSFFLMINRRKAISQVLALLTMENGLSLAAISLTYGMPLIVELGILLDVLAAVILLGILAYRIRETFDSTDVSKLRRLRG